MNPTPLPREPAGRHSLVEALKQIKRALREQRLIAGPGVEIDRTVNGTRITVKRDRKSSSSDSGAPARWA